MLAPGQAKKIIIHINEDTSSRQDFLYNEIISFLHGRGVAGATLIRPSGGFGSHRRKHASDGSRGEREHLPVRIEFIESPAEAEALLPALCELLTDGLIEAHDTTIIKSASREQPN